jgi:NADP-dependent 3-hydroxy acid dehydrogenase YdfG
MSKVWFVTGSSQGLGLAIVEAALESGASVIATARKPKQLQRLAEKYGTNVFLISLDVTNHDDVLKAVNATSYEKFGGIDIVVNNTGYAGGFGRSGERVIQRLCSQIERDNQAEREQYRFTPAWFIKAVNIVLGAQQQR